MSDLREAWAEIRAMVEDAAKRHSDDYGHDLCPWGFDATELPDALDYVGTVLDAEVSPPTVSFTPDHLNIGD